MVLSGIGTSISLTAFSLRWTLDKIVVTMDQVNDAVLIGVVSIMVVGTVFALFSYGMGIVH